MGHSFSAVPCQVMCQELRVLAARIRVGLCSGLFGLVLVWVGFGFFFNIILLVFFFFWEGGIFFLSFTVLAFLMVKEKNMKKNHSKRLDKNFPLVVFHLVVLDNLG